MNTAEQQKEFDEASKLLSEAKYPEAQEKFLNLYNQKITSPALESNLARALVETNHLGHGVWHYMNAVHLNRFDSAARSDLTLAQSKVEGGAGVPMKDPAEWGYTVGTYVRPLEALSIASLLLIGLLFLKVKRLGTRNVTIALSVGIGLFAGVTGLASLGSKILVVATDTNLRNAPLESSEVLMPLKAGTRAHLLRRSGNFAEIDRSGAFRGWIDTKDILSAP